MVGIIVLPTQSPPLGEPCGPYASFPAQRDSRPNDGFSVSHDFRPCRSRRLWVRPYALFSCTTQLYHSQENKGSRGKTAPAGVRKELLRCLRGEKPLHYR